MTRNEIIKLLEENFSENEEIKFVYNDDQGDVRGDVQYVDTHEMTICKGHWEWWEIYEDGNQEWVKLTNEEYRDILRKKSNRKYDIDRIRWVKDEEINDNRKCVFIN